MKLCGLVVVVVAFLVMKGNHYYYIHVYRKFQVGLAAMCFDEPLSNH